MRRLIICVLAIVGIGALGVVVGAIFQGMSPSDLYRISQMVVQQWMNRKTVEDRMENIESKHPELVDAANAIGSELTILVFKHERSIEMHAKGWARPRIYKMQGFSGVLGPKLMEGDGQIPEGVYGIEYMNPNSMFYLSLKVDYPNVFDRSKAVSDGRVGLGGDIMIHGGSASAGCVPVGDDGIEEIFYFVGKVGCENVRVIISPYDMRCGRHAEFEKSDVTWYLELCATIGRELSVFKKVP